MINSRFKKVDINNKNSELMKFLQNLGNLFFVYCMIIAMSFILFSFMTVECVVVGSSMSPTLNSNAKSGNDIVYVNRFDRDFAFGDMIVVNFEDKDPIIKRVVGVSGDKIDIVFVEDMGYFLEVNGTLIMEDYLNLKYDVEPTYLQNGMNHTYDNFQLLKKSHLELFDSDDKLVVPEGEVFVLGDNRHDSKDSTYYGTFEGSQLMGKVEFVRNSNDSEFKFYYNYIAGGKIFKTIGNCF